MRLRRISQRHTENDHRGHAQEDEKIEKQQQAINQLKMSRQILKGERRTKKIPFQRLCGTGKLSIEYDGEPYLSGYFLLPVCVGSADIKACHQLNGGSPQHARAVSQIHLLQRQK